MAALRGGLSARTGAASVGVSGFPLMNSTTVHFVRVANTVRGPLGLGQLRELASVDLVTAETEIAERADGPWVRLGTLALCAEVVPVRRAFGFKAAEFEELNRGPAPEVNVDDLKVAANRPPASFRGREIAVTPLGKRGTPEGGPLNEVQEMVLEVGRKVAANAPPVVLPPVRAAFPRWRWFLAAAILGSAGILSIPRFYEGKWSYEPMTFSIIMGWVVLYDGLLVYLLVLDRKVSATVRGDVAKKTEAAAEGRG